MANYNLEKQHAKGKLHAIERINALCDKDSFYEIFYAKFKDLFYIYI